MTTNKDFNFRFFNKELRAEVQFFEQLIEFLKKLTAKTELDIIGLDKRKECGYETLEFEEINFKPANCTLSKDAKICVFRFGDGDKYRLLGFFEKKQTALNIIGFDFNYSAYDHG